jgi:aryl-alcohol dehydrogenase-like predicted oxidoreductase
LTDPERNARVRSLKTIADELGCSLAQLAIAWCAANPRVSTVITGATTPAQVKDNMGALEVLGLLDEELMVRIADAVKG